MISTSLSQAFHPALLAWYQREKRHLPWRQVRDPYAIWVSEVMLQQTRVETVIPYYERWLQAFPTPSALASASEEQVLKLWEGLGYYSRARNLHRAAQIIAREHGGEIPPEPAAFSALPGVGPYTLGAVLSIAFDLPFAAVDGNVMRVLSRVLACDLDIAKGASRRYFEQAALALAPAGQSGDFNQALMELGALICSPVSPACGRCPVADLCAANEAGLQATLPVKSKAKAPRPLHLAVALLTHQGQAFLRQRPAEGLLAGLWEFAGVELAAPRGQQLALQAALQEQHGLTVSVGSELARFQHTFTHLRWHLRAYGCQLEAPRPTPTATERWVPITQLDQLPLPVAHRRLATLLIEKERQSCKT